MSRRKRTRTPLAPASIATDDTIFTKRCAQKQDGVWWSDTFYLEETLQRLFDLCRVVRDTSVFIFFLEESNSRALLMDQLLFLHANVEKLRLLLLRSTAQDKAEIMYLRSFCARTMDNMAVMCAEGFEGDIWRFKTDALVAQMAGAAV